MELGTNIRNWGPHTSAEHIGKCATVADDSTLDSIWVNDHILTPVSRAAGNDDFANGTWYEPMTVLPFLAGVTRRIKLGTAVLLLPLRDPLLVAKWAASLQALSHERLIVGVGPGWLGSEFRALGIDRRERGARTDVALEFLNRAFADDVVEHKGERFLFKPRPKQPTLLVGGAPQFALPRAAQYADGWIPAGIEPEVLGGLIGELRQRFFDSGRDAPIVVAMKTLPLDEPERAIDYALQFKAVGVNHLVHTQGYETVDAYRRVVDQLCVFVQPALV